MRRDVEFKVEDGTILRGYFHSSQDSAAPVIVMAHNFSGVKEQIDPYAAYFADGGFSVLVHDHRGFGGSDGTPRLELDASRQMADWRDAISFALAQPEVDKTSGVGIWGSSFAGGLAMVVAAHDSRVRCVVSQIPHVSGHRNGREMFNVAQRVRLNERFAADRVARFSGAEPGRIPVFFVDPDELCALPPAMSHRYIEFCPGANALVAQRSDVAIVAKLARIRARWLGAVYFTEAVPDDRRGKRHLYFSQSPVGRFRKVEGAKATGHTSRGAFRHLYGPLCADERRCSRLVQGASVENRSSPTKLQGGSRRR